MGFFQRLFGKKESTTSAATDKGGKPRYLRKEQSQGCTYEIYQGTDAESAKAFLLTKRVDKNLYYIVVETPEGNWGIDVKGLYLEKLLPWQTDLNTAQTEGRICKMPDLYGLELVAKGINNNFIAQIKCGKCENEWTDGVRYRNLTVVRCPQCKTFNKVDSDNFQVVLI